MIFPSKSCLTIPVRIFCFAIFSWQFYLLTWNFQEFHVHKRSTYYIPNEIELPEIRIQIPYQFALNDYILLTKYKSRFDEVCSGFSSNKDCNGRLTSPILFSKSLGPHLTLSDIANHSYSPEMLIQLLRLAGIKENPLKTGDCKLTSQASSSFLVIILKCLDSSGLPLKLSRTQAIVYNANYLLGFKLNATFGVLNLIYPEKALVEDNSYYVHLSLTPGKKITHEIRFTKHTENLLPSPYKTMCKNYNRRQSFEDCLNADSIEQTGLLFPGTSVSFDRYSELREMRFNTMFNNDNDKLSKIYERCQSIVAQPMCRSVQYSFKISTSSSDVSKGEESFLIYFTVSSEPDSLIESRPEFPLSDYLILSCSLFSSWFGISIMGQLLVASNLFWLAAHRKSSIVMANANEVSESQVDST